MSFINELFFPETNIYIILKNMKHSLMSAPTVIMSVSGRETICIHIVGFHITHILETS